MKKEEKKIDSDRFHKIYRIPNIDTHGEYLTIRKFLKKDFDSLPKLDDYIYTYMNNVASYAKEEEREARANREYNREIDGYNFYKKQLLTTIKKMLEKDENDILDNVYVNYIHCIYPDVSTRPESFVRLPYFARNRNIRDRHGYLILKTKDGKSAILDVTHNPYAYNQNNKKNLNIEIILKFAKYEYRPSQSDKRIPKIAHNLETNLEGLINYKTCQIENEKFDKIYYKQNKLFSDYILLVGERNGKLGTADGYVPPKYDDINGVIRVIYKEVNYYEVPKDTPCYITTLNGKEGAYFIGKRGHIDIDGLSERTIIQTSLKKIIIPPYFDKITLLDFSQICHPNHSMEEFISNPIFKVVLNGKEGIYLGGEKKFLAPPIFDVDSISNYDLDNQTVDGYIDGIHHIYQNGILKRIETVDLTISDDTKESLNIFINKVRKRTR